MRFINLLETMDAKWCAIDSIAVNFWAENPMVTQDFDLVIAAPDLERIVKALEAEKLKVERFQYSINIKGRSAVVIQISSEDAYLTFPDRAVPAEVHGILMRVASREDTLKCKIRAWSDPARRQSKRIKDLADIARLIEAVPQLWHNLPDELKKMIEKPTS